jgi:DNA-binding response OmpR family regulator
MLPDASGLDVLREIRATDGSNGRFDPGLPVVVLSGRGAPADRVRGLAEGADDYVVKPFHYEELVARLRAVLRRRAQRRQGPRRIGELFVDPSTREVRVAGRRVELANKEFVGTKPEDGLDKPFLTPTWSRWATDWATRRGKRCGLFPGRPSLRAGSRP